MLVFAGLIQKTNGVCSYTVNVTQDQLLTIERGTTGSKLAALLSKKKFLHHADWFALVIEITTAAQQSGEGGGLIL